VKNVSKNSGTVGTYRLTKHELDLVLQRAAFCKEFEKINTNESFKYYHFSLPRSRYGVWANGVLSESTFKKDVMKIKNVNCKLKMKSN